MHLLWSIVAASVIGGSGAAAGVPFPAFGASGAAAATTTPVPGVPSRLGLPEAIKVAAAFSPVLSTARAAYNVASGETDLSVSPLRPAAALSGTYQAQGGDFSGSVPARQTGVNISQLLFDGGRTIAQIRAARGTESAAAQSYRRALQTLAYGVAQAYYGALEAHSQTQLQLQILRQSLTQERLISAQIRAGTAARIDLETAQIPSAQARVAVVRAQGTELAADAAFANALGLRADSGVLPVENETELEASSLPPRVPLNYAQAVKEALRRRPDLLAAEDAYRSATEGVRVAALTATPVLTSSFGGTYSSFAPGIPWQNSRFAGASLVIPIVDQGTTKAQTAIADGKREQAKAAMKQVHLIVESDVRQALVQLVATRAALGQTRDELKKARDVLTATQRQYRAGQTTLPLLLNAQTQLAGAETDHLQALYGLRQAEQTYLYALGDNVSSGGTSP